ncbi:MAG TPA: CzcE family metal-binding protein [Burkholderiales bacterium]|nr:CzcE family metal-binding protein [Burkholderiales bacterium]
MKPFVQALVGLTLSAASLAATATVSESDMLGSPAQASAAQRTIVIDPKTRWITVERGEVVTFKVNGRDFAWAFNSMSSSFDLNRIAPAGTLDRNLKVYIWPNAQDLADK